MHNLMRPPIAHRIRIRSYLLRRSIGLLLAICLANSIIFVIAIDGTAASVSCNLAGGQAVSDYDRTYATGIYLPLGSEATTTPVLHVCPNSVSQNLLLTMMLFDDSESCSLRKPRPRKEDYEIHLGGDGPRVVIYIRVSSYKQAKGLSPEAQEEDLLKLAMSFKPSHIYVMFDYAKSGKSGITRKTRVIPRMQNACLIEGLLVRHVDRAGRDTFDLDDLCMPFIRKGGWVASLERVYRHNADDYQALSNEFVFAEKERIRNRERMMASKEKSFSDGNYNHSSVPPSYRRKDGPPGIERDPGWEGGVMRKVGDTLIERRSWKAAYDAIPEGLRKGVKRDGLRNLFHNPIIFGRPRMMRVEKSEESLRWFPDEYKPKFDAVFAEIEAKHEDKSDEIFAERLIEDYFSLAPLLIRDYQHAVECGCHFVLDGTYTDEEGRHLKLVCQKRMHYLEFPLRSKKVDWATIMKEYEEPRKKKGESRRNSSTRSSRSSTSRSTSENGKNPGQSTLGD